MGIPQFWYWNLAEQILTCDEPEGDSRNILEHNCYVWILNFAEQIMSLTPQLRSELVDIKEENWRWILWEYHIFIFIPPGVVDFGIRPPWV